jgi:N-acetylglucosaminyldiphosphoundecaprenol N-acetyl-beta-D-mannosaminyltransferase
MYLRKRDADGIAAARVSLATQENDCTITLSGVWEHSNLSPLREAFRIATASACDIRIDFAGVTQIDSACIALLMLLYGHQSKIEQGFLLFNVRPEVRRLLRMFCADYLADRADENSASVAVR